METDDGESEKRKITTCFPIRLPSSKRRGKWGRIGKFYFQKQVAKGKEADVDASFSKAVFSEAERCGRMLTEKARRILSRFFCLYIML